MRPHLKLTLFGAPVVTLDEEPLAGALTGKLLALFIYLAVTSGPHRREALADLFWSELPQGQRRSNLRYLLADLRRIVGDYLLITPQTVSFNRRAPYWLDVEVVRTTLGTETPHTTVAELAAARALCQGEFLAGLQVRNAPAFMQWIAEQRQELQALVARASQLALEHLPRHNLPGQLTPFFGREAEMADILGHLSQDDYRLLSIIGEGGVGKTRLALAVAQTILDFSRSGVPSETGAILDANPASNDKLKSKIKNLKFPDGVWFVPLVDVTATPDLPDQLAMAIAKALDFSLNGQGAPTRQVCHFLTHKRLLLLLDNFEQLAVHAPFLLTLLQQCPSVRLLITSRRPLNLQAEYPWRLTGLPLPSLAQATALSATELGDYAGIALFVERARRACPPFQMTAENQATVVAICHLLAGLPLGLELAAALCKEYTCAELLALLQTDYTVLATSLLDLPTRHRSISRVLEHSWCLLDQASADTLAACTIFQESFTPLAAQAVMGVTGATLQYLVDHSLLRAQRDEITGWRYNLHELVRHYAQKQLHQLPVHRQQVQAAHAAYYLKHIQQLAPRLLQEATAQIELRRDSANLAAAWQWCVAEARLDLLALSIEGVARFYRLAGLHNEAIQHFQPAILSVRRATTTNPTEAQPLLAVLLLSLSEFYRFQQRLDEAEMLTQEALTIGQVFADPVLQCRAYDELARLAQRRSQQDAMRTLAEQACRLAEQTGVVRLRAISLNTLGTAHLFAGDVVAAIDHYLNALHWLRHERDRKLESIIINNLGVIYNRLRDYGAAIHYLSQGLTQAQALNDPYGIAISYTMLGNLWLDLGAFERAQSAYTQALQIFAEVHDPYWASLARAGRAYIWQLGGAPAAAVPEYQQVLADVQGKMPLPEHLALVYLGDACCQLGDRPNGAAYYRRALALQNTIHLQFHLAEPEPRLAALLLQRGEGPAAQQLLEDLLNQVQHNPAAVAEPFLLYAASYRIFTANEDPRASTLLAAAHRLFQETLVKIEDAALRQSFLNHLPWRRELWTWVQAHVAI